MVNKYMPCTILGIGYFPIPYGCWCGITENWPPLSEPIDQFDAACKVHDYCYNNATKELGCTEFDRYGRFYNWHDEDGTVS